MGHQSHRCQWGVLRTIASPQVTLVTAVAALGKPFLDKCLLRVQEDTGWLTSHQTWELTLG